MGSCIKTASPSPHSLPCRARSQVTWPIAGLLLAWEDNGVIANPAQLAQRWGTPTKKLQEMVTNVKKGKA